MTLAITDCLRYEQRMSDIVTSWFSRVVWWSGCTEWYVVLYWQSAPVTVRRVTMTMTTLRRCVWWAAVSTTTPCWGPEPAKVCILYITRYMHGHQVWACVCSHWRIPRFSMVSLLILSPTCACLGLGDWQCECTISLRPFPILYRFCFEVKGLRICC